MKIIAAGKEYYLDELIENPVEKILSIIEHVAKEQALVFTGIKVDGEEVYDHIEEVLLNNINEIQVIECILVTEEQLYFETLSSLLSYAKRSLIALPILADEMYEASISTTSWGKLVDFIEGLQWIQTTAVYYEKYRSTLDFSKELENLNLAVLQKDNILIGDIIQYEVIPRYQEIEDVLAKVINEGEIHDKN